MLQRYTAIGKRLLAMVIATSTVALPQLQAQQIHTDLLQARIANHPLAIGPIAPIDGVEPAEGGVPPNTLCSGATVEALAVDGSLVRNGNNTGALNDWFFGVPVVWEGFTTSECATVTIEYCGTDPAFNAALLYLASGCPLTNYVTIPVEAVTNQSCGDGNYELTIAQLAPGTYYYPILMVPGTSEGPYTLTISAAACTNTAPPSALCDGAIALTVNEICEAVAGTAENATVVGTISGGCDGGDPSDGVWYSFVATNTFHNVAVDPSANYSAVVDVFSGDCNALTQLTCFVADEENIDIDLQVTGLTIGETYFVRVYDWFAGEPISNTFTICITGEAGEPCDADAGTLTADIASYCYEEMTITMSATPNGDAVVPDGFEVIYLLTLGQDLVIMQTGATPSFDVNAVGNYTILTLVYDPNTLDPGNIELGVTTSDDVNAQLIQGGGLICGSLDMIGAPIVVELCCDAEAGTITADMTPVCFDGNEATISATGNGDVVVPPGFEVAYVLTSGVELLVVEVGAMPSFIVTAEGNYTIHTLVHDPSTFNLAVIVPGFTTAFNINGALIQGGGTICGSMDMVGAPITVEQCCAADAGTLTADAGTVCFVDDLATLRATSDENAAVPDGFETVFILTQGEDLVIVATDIDPRFEVTALGAYTIHTLVYDPNTLDLGLIEFGVTTASDINALLTQGGGAICASLDMTGAPITVEVCCAADAGTLTADAGTVCFVDDLATLRATSDENAVVPDGFETVYILTQGEDLVIVATDIDPRFEVTALGAYTIHTLVYDPNTLDLGLIEFGVTTASDINALLTQGGGAICASLDMTGAPITVEVCCDAEAGTMTANAETVCFENEMATIGAIGNGDMVVPDGFQKVYLLTLGDDLVIMQAQTELTFDVTAVGGYTIHTLVYDPNTLDLGLIEFGVTTAGEVNALLIQGGGVICASLDMVGAPITVEICCDQEAGTLTADLDTVCMLAGVATVSATANGDAVVPDGYQTIYLLTEGETMVITKTGPDPSFLADSPGDYTIHTLVYDPNTFDVGIIELGVTTAEEVNALLAQGGGTICASLDMTGAMVTVLDCAPANDDCVNAIGLTINLVENCPAAAVTGDNTYATQEDGNEPGCDATAASYADVWYSFNSGMNIEVTLTLDQMDMEDWAVTVSDACTGGTEIACEINPTEPIVLTTTENTTYWVRVYSNLEFGVGGEFTLCLTGDAPTFICDGGEVAGNGDLTSISVCQDANVDVIDFSTTSTSMESYSYVVTDEADVIVALVSGNSMDFNMLALGSYRVYGLSHNGALEGTAPGSDLANVSSTGACLEQSTNFVSITVEICIGIEGQESTTWSLFPNPSNGDFNLRYAGTNATTTVEVIDVEGRLVMQDRFAMTQGATYTMNAAGRLAPGMYTVRLIADGQVNNLRLSVR